MSESKLETVSLLVDNTQTSQDELDVLLQDETLSDSWHNYHLIGDVMRGDVASHLDIDLSDSIAAALAQEPTVLAPQKKSFSAQVKAKVIQFSKPFGQVAIAASAAGLMVFGVQQNSADNELDVVNPVIQTVPFGGTASPVSYNYAQPSPGAQKQALIEQQRRFQALLNDHNQQVKLKAAIASTDESSLEPKNAPEQANTPEQENN